MKNSMLTKAQKKLSKEIDEVVELLALNHKDIESVEKGARLAGLQSIKNQLVRGEVITDYMLIDEMLNCIICKYYFREKKSFAKLWKTKKFKNFNYFVIERMSLLNKLDLVKEIVKVPSGIDSGIRRINDLRNGLAHAFFPENLRRNKPVYCGKNIYSLAGLRSYMEDKKNIIDFLFKKAYQLDISGMDFRARD